MFCSHQLPLNFNAYSQNSISTVSFGPVCDTVTTSPVSTTVQKNVCSNGKEIIGLSRRNEMYEYTFNHSFIH